MHYYREYFLIAGLSVAEQAAPSIIMQRWCSVPYSEQDTIKTTIFCMEHYHFLEHFKVVEFSTLKQWHVSFTTVVTTKMWIKNTNDIRDVKWRLLHFFTLCCKDFLVTVCEILTCYMFCMAAYKCALCKICSICYSVTDFQR